MREIISQARLRMGRRHRASDEPVDKTVPLPTDGVSELRNAYEMRSTLHKNPNVTTDILITVIYTDRKKVQSRTILEFVNPIIRVHPW